jgi:uncharacterized BrkB/YihY/UPF0761 family membrane protein
MMDQAVLMGVVTLRFAGFNFHAFVGSPRMDAETKAYRKAWRAQARADLCRPSVWIFFGCLYVATFLLVSLLTFVLGLVVPHLPWISKPYVSTDPPPLILGFYCANLIPAMLVVAIPVLYIFVPPWRVPFLSSKEKANDKTQQKR